MALVSAASAQANSAQFDALAEGVIGPSYTEDGVVFSDLDRYLGGSGSPFVIEDASTTLGGLPGFTSPGTLGFGGYSPGGGAAFSRCGSFKITPPSPAGSAELALFLAGGSSAGNLVTLEARLAGALVASDSVVVPGAFGPHALLLAVSGATFDTLHLVGSGVSNSGSFFALVDSVRIGAQAIGAPYCFGDGTGAQCPCGNAGAPGHGCANSTSSGGAVLAANGSASISAANLTLLGTGAQPGQPGLYFQGNNPTAGGFGFANGDGLRCAGGGIRRLQVVAADALGASQTTANVAAQGLVNPGDTKYYQWWYRNPSPAAPCGTGFNLSNGLEVTWSL